MDIVTHGMMGVVMAAPFAQQYPEASIAFMMGSVVPDLDAVSRVAGRRTFLKCHQNRTRNFNTRFGELLVTLGASGTVKGVQFNV